MCPSAYLDAPGPLFVVVLEPKAGMRARVRRPLKLPKRLLLGRRLTCTTMPANQKKAPSKQRCGEAVRC